MRMFIECTAPPKIFGIDSVFLSSIIFTLFSRYYSIHIALEEGLEHKWVQGLGEYQVTWYRIT